MEILYLLCSIVYNSVSSILLSLLLPIGVLLRRLRGGDGADNGVYLYEGTVWHERRRPVHHSFRYPVRYAFIDLDYAASHSPPDHLSADEARRLCRTSGPVFLLTIPPSVGYEQNPLSLYYCYDMEGSKRYLKKCIAEVTNTPWGERVTFVFDPESDLVAKPLHVSPFMDMLGNWRMRVKDPGDELYVSIAVQHPHLRDYFTATLKAKRMSSAQVLDHKIFFWFMPHKVAVWIYWHAFKLWWKNVSFIQHPRYSCTSYREEAFFRDGKIHHGKSAGSDQDEFVETIGCLANGKYGTCRFAWREAKWPWS